MARYYTVDRSGKLSTGQEVRPDTDFSASEFFPVQDHFTRQDLEELTQQLFPGGLTFHGKRYLLDECLIMTTPLGPAPYVPHIPMIELVFELVRRVFFAEKPSRMTSIFAWATRSEAVAFQKDYGGASICEIEAETFFRGDMNLLFLGGSGVGAMLFAMKYWRGESSPTPRWEYLLVPPVRVIGITKEGELTNRST